MICTAAECSGLGSNGLDDCRFITEDEKHKETAQTRSCRKESLKTVIKMLKYSSSELMVSGRGEEALSHV